MKTQMKTKTDCGTENRAFGFISVYNRISSWHSASYGFKFSTIVNIIRKILEGCADFDGSAPKPSAISLSVYLYCNVVGFSLSLSV